MKTRAAQDKISLSKLCHAIQGSGITIFTVKYKHTHVRICVHTRLYTQDYYGQYTLKVAVRLTPLSCMLSIFGDDPQEDGLDLVHQVRHGRHHLLHLLKHGSGLEAIPSSGARGWWQGRRRRLRLQHKRVRRVGKRNGTGGRNKNKKIKYCIVQAIHIRTASIKHKHVRIKIVKTQNILTRNNNNRPSTMCSLLTLAVEEALTGGAVSSM